MNRYVVYTEDRVSTAETLKEAQTMGGIIIPPGKIIPLEVYNRICPVIRADTPRWFEKSFFEFRYERANLTLEQCVVAYCRSIDRQDIGRDIFKFMGKPFPSDITIHDFVKVIGNDIHGESDQIGCYGEVVEVFPNRICLLGRREYIPASLEVVPKFKVGEVVKGDSFEGIREIKALFRGYALLENDKLVAYEYLRRLP